MFRRVLFVPEIFSIHPCILMGECAALGDVEKIYPTIGALSIERDVKRIIQRCIQLIRTIRKNRKLWSLLSLSLSLSDARAAFENKFLSETFARYAVSNSTPSPEVEFQRGIAFIRRFQTIMTNWFPGFRILLRRKPCKLRYSISMATLTSVFNEVVSLPMYGRSLHSRRLISRFRF